MNKLICITECNGHYKQIWNVWFEVPEGKVLRALKELNNRFLEIGILYENCCIRFFKINFKEVNYKDIDFTEKNNIFGFDNFLEERSLNLTGIKNLIKLKNDKGLIKKINELKFRNIIFKGGNQHENILSK